MVGGRNIQNDIINLVLSISLIVLAIGLILFLIENATMQKYKIALFAILFLLPLVAISICMYVSRQDIISTTIDKKITIASISLISLALAFVITSIIIIKANITIINYIISLRVKLLYLCGTLGLLGASFVNLCKNTHRVSTIGIPSAVAALSIIICGIIL